MLAAVDWQLRVVGCEVRGCAVCVAVMCQLMWCMAHATMRCLQISTSVGADGGHFELCRTACSSMRLQLVRRTDVSFAGCGRVVGAVTMCGMRFVKRMSSNDVGGVHRALQGFSAGKTHHQLVGPD